MRLQVVIRTNQTARRAGRQTLHGHKQETGWGPQAAFRQGGPRAARPKLLPLLASHV